LEGPEGGHIVPKEAVPMQLVLDLVGPFVVHFCEGKVRISAPLCADHHANVQTDSDDVSVPGIVPPVTANGKPKEFVYRLTGPISSGDKCKCLNPEQLLVVKRKMDPIAAGQCHSILEVPSPNTMVPLLPEQIWMHKNGSETWVDTKTDIVNGFRARGLRFIYTSCPEAPDVQPLDKPVTFNPNALGLDPPHYQITLRFATNSCSPDEHHEDAYSCFQEMRTLIPGSDMWRVDFADAAKGPFLPQHHGGANPVDCGAAVLVVQDPG
jgi:hypothetical protein